MSLLSPTGLEDHPNGTTNVGGIVNANWQRLNELFDPALAGADPAINAFLAALLRAALPTGADAALWWNNATSRLVSRPGHAAVTYSASLNFSMLGALIQTVGLTGDLDVNLTNVAAGRTVEVILTADGTPRNLTWDAGIVWLGVAAPATLPAGKTGSARFRAKSGTISGGVFATWEEEP